MRVIALIAAALTLVGLAPAAMAEPKTLSGTVTYRERIALPPGAVIEVRLVDVSRADAPSTTIAETSVKSTGQVPVAYRLQYDDAQIRPGRSYALQARITVDDRLWFITGHHPVFVSGPDNTDIVVQRVSAKPDASPATHPTGLRSPRTCSSVKAATQSSR
jgi:putative lipoprotein